MERKKFNIAIIGGGPAGLSAAIYVKRSNNSVAVFERSVPGGKINITSHIDNYLGFPNIDGITLANKIYEHANKENIEIIPESVVEIRKEENIFIITSDEASYEAKAIIVATGTSNQKLGIEGEEEYIGRGVSYCATCDGMFFKGKDVAVIGSNEMAVEEVLYLSNIVNKVYFLVNGESIIANDRFIDQLNSANNIDIIYGATAKKIVGDAKVNSLIYSNLAQKDISINVDCVFPFSKITSQLSFLRLLNLSNKNGFIIVNISNMETNIKGVFACGDIVNKQLRQIITAASDGAIAATSAIKYLKDVKYEQKT